MAQRRPPVSLRQLNGSGQVPGPVGQAADFSNTANYQRLTNVIQSYLIKRADALRQLGNAFPSAARRWPHFWAKAGVIGCLGTLCLEGFAFRTGRLASEALMMSSRS